MEWLHTLHTVYLALHGVYPPYGVAAHPLVDLSIRANELYTIPYMGCMHRLLSSHLHYPIWVYAGTLLRP